MMLEDDLRDLGFERVMVVRSLAQAMVAIADELPTIALLDYNLTDGVSLPLAENLSRKGVPCVFMSGDSRMAQDQGVDPHSILSKPFTPSQLQQALARALTP